MNNEDFFKKVNNNIGIEAFEELKESDTMERLKELDELNVDLNLMSYIIKHLITNIDELRDKSIESSNKLAIENMILKFMIFNIKPSVIEQIENITYVITDSISNIMEGENEVH